MCPMQDSKFGEKLKKIPVYSAINSSFRLSSAAEDKCLLLPQLLDTSAIIVMRSNSGRIFLAI